MEQSAESKYAAAFSRCRPQHGRCDDFSLRHPKMPLSQRAKLFAPYSALVGFEELIDEKLRLYVPRRELNEEEQAETGRTLSCLYEATRRRDAPPVRVCVTFFVPCPDENHEAYGRGGSYETLCGTVRRIDPVLTKSLFVDERPVDFADIAAITILEEA